MKAETKRKEYEGMGIFQEAKQRRIDGMGYRARRFKTIWKSKKVSWRHLTIDWGIRWSDKWQILPLWYVRDNCHRALMFGFWKLHFTIFYSH